MAAELIKLAKYYAKNGDMRGAAHYAREAKKLRADGGPESVAPRLPQGGTRLYDIYADCEDFKGLLRMLRTTEVGITYQARELLESFRAPVIHSQVLSLVVTSLRGLGLLERSSLDQIIEAADQGFGLEACSPETGAYLASPIGMEQPLKGRVHVAMRPLPTSGNYPRIFVAERGVELGTAIARPTGVFSPDANFAFSIK
jgi:hypothetical protein